MKKQVEVFDYANDILKALKKGILVTAKVGDKVNPMAISWGTLGVEWNKPIFTVFVRTNRYTRQMLEENPEFTINIPLDSIDPAIIKVCGTMSGKNVDKVAELGLTTVQSDVISVPGLKELPLTLECKVIYTQDQDPKAIPLELKERFYPTDVDSGFHGANCDYHIAYYGEIVNAYIIE